MKRLLFLIAILCVVGGLLAQGNKISVTSAVGTNVDTLLQRHLAGEGVVISNGRFNNSTGNINASSIGTFQKNNTNFPFSRGIYMHTNLLNGGASSYSDNSNNFTDKNLSDLVSNIEHGCALDFEFTAYADTFSFNYIFASQEYASYTCTQYNDVFAFFLKGFDPVTGNIRTWNVALLPNTLTVQNPNGIPVTINSVNGGCSPGKSCGTLPNCYNGTYSQYFTTGYNNYYPSSLGSVTGSTIKMTATSSIIGCQTYKMHLAISNADDDALPSSIFLEEGSFYCPTVDLEGVNSNGDTITTGGVDTLIQNCKDCDITFSLPEGSPPPSGNLGITVSTSGNAFLGQDFILLMPNGQALSATNNLFVFDTTLVKLHMEISPTAQFAPNEIKEVIVYFVSERCPGDVSSRKTDTLHFYLRGNDTIKLKKGNPMLTFGACDTLKSIAVDLLRGTPDLVYQWIPQTGIIDTASLTPNTCITQSGNYKVVAKDQWNCLSDTADVEVKIVQKPVFTVSRSPNFGCVPLHVTLHTQYTPPTASLRWDVENSSTGFAWSDTLAMSYVTLPDSGYYDLKLYVEAAPGCADSSVIPKAIHVSHTPVAAFSYSPASPHNGETIYFTNESEGNNITNYVWNFGDGHTSHDVDPEHAYHLRESSDMVTMLTVVNADGCSDNVSQSIYVEDDFAVFVPSGFTPNLDGKNEVFKPVVTDVTRYEFTIYSRNGTVIFHSVNSGEGWDGKINDRYAPEGVYVYQLRYARIGLPDELILKTGSFALIR